MPSPQQSIQTDIPAREDIGRVYIQTGGGQMASLPSRNHVLRVLNMPIHFEPYGLEILIGPASQTVRPRKGVLDAYCEASHQPSVPAFGTPVTEIIQRINDQRLVQREGTVSTVKGDYVPKRATGTDREPLGECNRNANIRAGDKRQADTYIDLTGSSPKRAKFETAVQSTIIDKENNGFVIDLTGHETQTIRPAPTRSTMYAPNMQYVQVQRGPRENREKTRRPLPPAIVIQRDTNTTLTRCASKIHAAIHSIELDRDYLRERWEIDQGLQLQEVTDDLAALNHRFQEAERALGGAVGIVEGRLLLR